MANIINQLQTSIGNFSWSGMGNIAMILSIFLLIILLFVAAWFIMWWKSYHINVKIYEPFGQISDETRKSLLNKETRDDALNAVVFDTIRYKRTHGKFVSVKGTPFFSTFMPFRKHEPISMEFLFNDGVHLLRLSKEIYIPIPKPKTLVNVGENVVISVADNNKWVAWNNIMAERVNNKYQDADAQKRATIYFVVGIVAIVLIGAFILWLIYSSTNKAYSAADKLAAFAEKLGGGSERPI